MTYRANAWAKNGAKEPTFATTTEIDTGWKWTDGKAIYRTGFSGNMASSNPEIAINTSGIGIDQVVMYWGRTKSGSTGGEDYFISMPGTLNGGSQQDQLLQVMRKSEYRAVAGAASVLFDSAPFVMYVYYSKV